MHIQPCNLWSFGQESAFWSMRWSFQHESFDCRVIMMMLRKSFSNVFANQLYLEKELMVVLLEFAASIHFFYCYCHDMEFFLLVLYLGERNFTDLLLLLHVVCLYEGKSSIVVRSKSCWGRFFEDYQSC